MSSSKPTKKHSSGDISHLKNQPPLKRSKHSGLTLEKPPTPELKSACPQGSGETAVPRLSPLPRKKNTTVATTLDASVEGKAGVADAIGSIRVDSPYTGQYDDTMQMSSLRVGSKDSNERLYIKLTGGGRIPFDPTVKGDTAKLCFTMSEQAVADIDLLQQINDRILCVAKQKLKKWKFTQWAPLLKPKVQYERDDGTKAFWDHKMNGRVKVDPDTLALVNSGGCRVVDTSGKKIEDLKTLKGLRWKRMIVEVSYIFKYQLHTGPQVNVKLLEVEIPQCVEFEF